MLKRIGMWQLVFGLLLAATTAQAHGPIPVPVDIVKQMLTRSGERLARYHRVFGVDPARLNQILADPAAPAAQKAQALIILAEKPAADASKWYAQYKDQTENLALRYAVLYLGARLGHQETRAAIIEILTHPPDKAKQHFAAEARLLRGLVELTNADEFTHITDTLFTSKQRFFPYDRLERVTLQSALYKGNARQRAKAAATMLTMWDKAPELTEESLRFMIKQQDATPYLTSWRLHHPALIYYLDRLGHSIQHKAGKARFVKITDARANQAAKPDVLAEKIVRSMAGQQQAAFQQLLVPPKAYALLSSLGEGRASTEEPSLQKREKTILQSWQQLQRDARQRGMDLRQAQFKSASYQPLVIIGGLQFTPLDITFSIASQEYRVRLTHSVLLDGQWHIAGRLQWL